MLRSFLRSSCATLERPSLRGSDSSLSISADSSRLRDPRAPRLARVASRCEIRYCARSDSQSLILVFRGIGILYPRFTRGREHVAQTTSPTEGASRRTAEAKLPPSLNGDTANSLEVKLDLEPSEADLI